MKRVFANSADVCHVWAQQRQQQGSAGNIYFEGALLYSYGAHYKLAKIHTAGNSLVLINSRGYSNSTAKHTNHARQAVSHLKTLDVPNVDPQSATDHAENVKHFLDIIADGQKLASRALKHGAGYIQQAQQAGADHNFYIKFFKIKARAVNIKALFTPQAQKRALAQVKEESARVRQKNKERAEEAKANFEAWKAGAGVDAWQFKALPVALRLKDAVIETSHGARCDLSDALALVDALIAGADVKGFSFGIYRVTDWQGDTLVIGCHQIPRAEVVRMCKLIKEA